MPSDINEESPPNVPILGLDVGITPSPSKNYTSYSQLILHIAKVLDLAVEQPISSSRQGVQTPPLHLGFIPSLLDLMKESWIKPSSSNPIERRVENLYKTMGIIRTVC